MNDVEERIRLAFEPYRSKKDLADLSEPSSTRREQPAGARLTRRSRSRRHGPPHAW